MTCECGQAMERLPPSDYYVAAWACWRCRAMVVTPRAYVERVTVNVGLSAPVEPSGDRK
jgi:hypothetical protein